MLDALAVLPEEQRKGYGRKLIEFAEREARVRGHDSITLLSPVSMTRNRRIYRDAGYVEGDIVMSRGNHHVVMTKALT